MEEYQWYVLQVRTGEELNVLHTLRKQDIQAVVPRENRLERRGGKWNRRVYTLMPGYVFVKCRYTDSLYYIVSGIASVLRWLTSDRCPAALSAEEASYIDMYDLYGVADPSIIKQVCGKWVVISGILIALGDHIVRVDRHARRAYVQMPVLGAHKPIGFSVVIQ